MKKLYKYGITLMLFATIAMVFTSCYKKKDTIAVVTIVDAGGNPISGADVKLNWYNDTLPEESRRPNLEQKGTSDGSGKATFNYNEFYKSGQAGVFVLDVYVNGVVRGIIKIEEQTTSEETITVP